MYRVLGSPYVLTFHQHVAYLRLKRLPFKVYCRTFTTTLLYAFLLRARNAFCAVAPDTKSYLQMWQLMEAVESASKSSPLLSPSSPSTLQNANSSFKPRKMALNKRTHPNLHLANWTLVVYASWWLAKTGAMYRWVEGEGTDVVEGYLRYFFLVSGIGLAGTIAKPFRRAIQKLISISGVSPETAPYMREHFIRMCTALDAHLREHPEMKFVLGTPHPTLADVTLGAVFSAYFLMDDPPATLIGERFPNLSRYLEHITGWRGGVFVETYEELKDNSSAEEAEDDADYADVVPESLGKFLQLVEEVLPFMLSQCAAFHAFMAGDGVRQLRREPLEGVWKGCSGYLLPQITEVKSLMIIDSGVYTICARSQDLEIALLAAREVVDDEEEEEEEKREGHEMESIKQKNVNPGEETKRIPHTDSNTVDKEKMNVLRSSASSECEASGNDHRISNAPVVCSNDAPLRGTTRKTKPQEGGVDPEMADFHHVFTTEGGRGRAAVQLRPFTSGGKLSNVTVDTRLRVIRDMLCKMHHPHYTLASVFHGRKVFVAAIPEYEAVCIRKKRKQDMEMNKTMEK